MSTIINLNNKSVKPEQISIFITCPSCKNSYNITLKSSQFQKNCRCRNTTFHVSVVNLKGRISVTVLCQEGFNQPVEVYPDSWEIE